VHLGQEIGDPGTGRFRSRYDAATLAQIGQERLAEWKSAPPLLRPKSLTQEDQYLSEGHLHVQERNRKWDAGDIASAWSENLILERFYAPVLDTPSYVSRIGHRWPDAQRTDGEQRSKLARSGSASLPPYESQADATEGRHFIRTWPKSIFWAVVLLVMAATLGASFAFDRRRF
jgi:hypothetical protein